MCNYFGYELEVPEPKKTIITRLQSQQGRQYNYDRTTNDSYVLNTIDTPLYALAIQLRNPNLISAVYICDNSPSKRNSRNIYDIKNNTFPIYFELQQGTEHWFLKKDITKTLQDIEYLEIRIAGIYDDIYIYVTEN